ncbi:hypothetical protein [Mycobacterium sp. SM3041]|uniref:hypothetical protein n=1 Tax=Mycobacterium sp. SM3041 TaxID=3114291 RepID=UPI0032049CA7
MAEQKTDVRALAWLAASIDEERPDEIVCIEGSATLLDHLREAFDGPIGVHGGHFEVRHRVTKLPAFHDIAPGWISTGTDTENEGGQVPGNTALRSARWHGKSVVMGHTHRLGIVSETHGYGGTITRTLTGIEVGHLVDLKTAPTADRIRQQGCDVLTVEGQHVRTEPVPTVAARRTVAR